MVTVERNVTSTPQLEESTVSEENGTSSYGTTQELTTTPQLEETTTVTVERNVTSTSQLEESTVSEENGTSSTTKELTTTLNWKKLPWLQ